MGQITSLFVRKVLAQVDSPADKPDLLRSVGIDPDGPPDASHMVTARDYYAFLERLTTLDRDPTTLPLRVGATMRCDEYGAFGLAWKSAPNLRGSYERAERYARMLTSVSSYEVEKTKGGAYMHLHRAGERRLGLRLSNEATIASITAISREVSTVPFQAEAVFFRHPAPASLAGHEDYFGCPVYFDSDRDALLVSRETLQNPNRLGDESIARFFDNHLEGEISRLEDDGDLAGRVRGQVSQALSEGVPRISDVAGQLGMSGRTLQRKLADQGYSYQSLVDEARRHLAGQLLRETDYALVEVAFMTGFSEQSAFSRAFKRWEGQTPRSYRLNAS
ncbi:MAG TPA: AraC family transcriptional regulator [Calditrichia bacterium]|nr:AraC family transcriptional regulator [Calditrichia bacterium]